MRFQPYSVAGGRQNPGSAVAPVSPAPVRPDDVPAGIGRPFRRHRGLLLRLALAVAVSCPAQSRTRRSAPSTGTPSTASHRHVARRHRARDKKKEAPAVAVPPAPPPPLPPARQPAHPAEISFSQGRLTIHAQNSSLVEMLRQISRSTGLVVKGLSHDARMYGNYGPGNVTATVSKLLDGAGYNYVMIGAGGTNPHATLLLTSTNASTSAGPAMPAAPAANAPSAGNAATPAMADPSAPVTPKTPQQIFDELRQMHPQPK